GVVGAGQAIEDRDLAEEGFRLEVGEDELATVATQRAHADATAQDLVEPLTGISLRVDVSPFFVRPALPAPGELAGKRLRKLREPGAPEELSGVQVVHHGIRTITP